MANETYFKNFNTIQYGNNTVVDITERVVTLNNLEKNPYVYYPLEVTQGSRADQIADASFNDPFSSWVLYLSNDITDPYYEWPLDDYQFNKFIELKYGSMETAVNKVSYWRNDWSGKDSISVSAYNSQIAGNPTRIKYWKPNYNYGGGVISYSRTQHDWKVNTNKILQFSIKVNGFTPVKTVTLPDGTIQNEYFIPNEIVTINDGTAQVLQSNSSVLIVNNPQNITEEIYYYELKSDNDITISNKEYSALNTNQKNLWTAVVHTPPEGVPQTGLISGRESKNFASFDSCNMITNNIPEDEFVYWKAVSCYDTEFEKNSGNRTIRVMQPQYVPKYIYNVKTLLSNA
jgi:hypothetical protein